MDQIPIGRPRSFKEIYTAGQYAVFEKATPDGGPIYIIGRIAGKTEISFKPASVTDEFSSPEEAIEALARWASDPPVPAPVPKPRQPRGTRTTRRRQKPITDQGELGLKDPRKR
jgi:hypothetical protein